jgi:hypothetical protein
MNWPGWIKRIGWIGPLVVLGGLGVVGLSILVGFVGAPRHELSAIVRRLAIGDHGTGRRRTQSDG